MGKTLRGSAADLEAQGGLRPLEYFAVNLTDACNLKCVGCCNKRDIQRTGQILSMQEIARLQDEARDLGARVLVVMGEGEPFLDARLPGIIEMVHARRMIPYIFTNGILLDEELVKYLKDHEVSLIIHLDTLIEERYNNLTQTQGLFTILMRNIEMIRKVYFMTYSAGSSQRSVATNTVVMPYNLDELDIINRFAGDDFVAVFNLPMQRGRAENNSGYLHNPAVEQVIKDKFPDMIPLGTASDGAVCAYQSLGVTTGLRGEGLICPYVLEAGLGSILDIGLKAHYTRARALVTSFYERHGQARCIVRHPNYALFVEELRKCA